MVSAIGLDVVENARMEAGRVRFGDRFIDRILSTDERAIYEKRQDKIGFLSGRFAAKEAVIKALGQYLDKRPPYSAIEILNHDDGSPYLRLPEDITAQLKGATAMVSISHEKNYAAAMAIFQEK